MTAVCTERIRTCPTCGSGRARVACRAHERLYHLSPETFEYVRCSGCGVVYQSLRPAEADIAAFYPSDYGPYQAAPAVRHDAAAVPQGPHVPLHPGFRRKLRGAALKVLGRVNAAIARRLPDPLPGALHAMYDPPRPGAILLDFGCGSAAFLDQARRRGWDTLGVDFVPGVVDAVRSAGHRGMLLTPTMWESIPDGSIDAVRMNHVLEHLYAPHETLAHLQRKLRPGGRLHLATPNAACATFALLGQRWFSLDCPRHIVLYSPKTVRPLLQRAGFREITCYNEVLTKDMARSLGYLLQDWGQLDDHGVSTMPDRPILNGMLFGPARLAALLGRADRFHAIVSK
ncbi:MAG: class I SAM-dependent methyltransferase [Gemmataceae bacterium]